MIFTEHTENNEIVFNEADSKSKVKVKNREDILRDTGRLVKSELNSLESHASFRTNKEYDRTNFINGKCEFVTIVHIKKSAEPYIGTQYENAKAILNILSDICAKVNTKLPSGCSVKASYKGSPNSDTEWDGWIINLTIPIGKTEFIGESYTGGGNMFFTEQTEDNEVVFNEAKYSFSTGLSSLGIKCMKKTYIDICNKVISYIKSHKKENEIYYPGCGSNEWTISPSELADQSITAAFNITKGIPLINRHSITQKAIPICRLVNEDEKTMNELFIIADKCINKDDRNFLYISKGKRSLSLRTYAIRYESSIYNDNEVLSFSGNNGGSYIHDALYESYIQAKIDSEDRLAYALKESMVISEADYSNIRVLQEGKITNKIKNVWKRFIAFIKGLFAKFMESMSNILLSEKKYLEKYKDIILNKKPKEDMEYSYTGNYNTGINRLNNTEVPIFDYSKYKNELEEEDDGALVNRIMQGKDFNYDDGATLAEQFKSYFLALDEGQKTGKFSELNMKEIYDFCYNFNKIKGIVDKDINRLEASTRAIEAAIKKELNATNNDAAGDKVDKQETNTTTNTASEKTDSNGAKTADKNSSATAEASIFTEADKKASSTGLEIGKTSSDPTSKMSSTKDKDEKAEGNAVANSADAAKTGNKAESDISNAANKWIKICRPLIAAKLTASEQIAKDYMAIIRAHVRSYGGSDKKSNSDNASNMAAKHPYVIKAKQDADAADKEADATAEKNKDDQNAAARVRNRPDLNAAARVKFL